MRALGLRLSADLLIGELAQPSVTEGQPWCGAGGTGGRGAGPSAAQTPQPSDVGQPLDTQMSPVPPSGRPKTAVLSWPVGMGVALGPLLFQGKSVVMPVQDNLKKRWL